MRKARRVRIARRAASPHTVADCKPLPRGPNGSHVRRPLRARRKTPVSGRGAAFVTSRHVSSRLGHAAQAPTAPAKPATCTARSSLRTTRRAKSPKAARSARVQPRFAALPSRTVWPPSRDITRAGRRPLTRLCQILTPTWPDVAGGRRSSLVWQPATTQRSLRIQIGLVAHGHAPTEICSRLLPTRAAQAYCPWRRQTSCSWVRGTGQDRTGQDRTGQVRRLIWHGLLFLILAAPFSNARAGEQGVGAQCKTHEDCGTGARCYDPPDGRCLCEAGMLACGGACQDLANDPTNCGSCGVVCENMESCIAGRCLSAAVLREASWIGAAEQVSGGNPEATCRVDGELAPQKSLTAPHAITMFAGYARVSNDNSAFTYAIPLTPWSGVVGGGILAPLGWTKAGDNWTTSSPNNGYEYLTSMLMNTTAGTPYVGIAASLGGDIASSVWTNNFTPVEPSVDHKVDGPTACFDQGGTDLWIAAVDGHSNAVDPQPGVDAYLFRNCTGVPNSAGCLLTKRKRVYGTYDGHATVTVQPSTHSAIIGHREGGSIWLHIMEHDFPYMRLSNPFHPIITGRSA